MVTAHDPASIQQSHERPYVACRGSGLVLGVGDSFRGGGEVIEWMAFIWVLGALFTTGAQAEFIRRHKYSWSFGFCVSFLAWPFLLGVQWSEK